MSYPLNVIGRFNGFFESLKNRCVRAAYSRFTMLRVSAFLKGGGEISPQLSGKFKKIN